MEFQKKIEEIKSGKLSPIYIVQGKEDYLQNWARQVFLESVVAPKDQELNVGRFNMEEISVQTAVEDAESVPFFGDRRLVMIDKPYFLTGEKEKAKIDHQLERLPFYLETPLDSSVVVFFAPYEKLDSRKKIVKQLKKVAVLLEASSLEEKDVRVMVQSKLQEQGVSMETSVLQLFLEKLHYSLTDAMREIDKLILSAMDTKIIDSDLVATLVPKSLEQNIFELGEAVLRKDSKVAIEIYRDLLLQKEDPIKMNAILLGQFRLLLQVSYLQKEGYHEPEMQKVLGIHPYRVKLALGQSRKFSIALLEAAYRSLVETEYALKTGLGIKELQLETFILKFCQKSAS